MRDLIRYLWPRDAVELGLGCALMAVIVVCVAGAACGIYEKVQAGAVS